MQTEKTAAVSDKVGLTSKDIEETLITLTKESAAIEAFVMVSM